MGHSITFLDKYPSPRSFSHQRGHHESLSSTATGSQPSLSWQYKKMANPICFRLLMHTACLAFSLACCKAGMSIAARILIMVITTKSSIKVNPCIFCDTIFGRNLKGGETLKFAGCKCLNCFKNPLTQEVILWIQSLMPAWIFIKIL